MTNKFFICIRLAYVMVRGSGASIASRPKPTRLGTLQLSPLSTFHTQTLPVVIHWIYITRGYTFDLHSHGYAFNYRPMVMASESKVYFWPKHSQPEILQLCPLSILTHYPWLYTDLHYPWSWQEDLEYTFNCGNLKGGYRNLFYSSIGPVGHNI